MRHLRLDRKSHPAAQNIGYSSRSKRIDSLMGDTDTGDVSAVRDLRRVQEQAGGVAEAQQLYERAVKAGDLAAALDLSRAARREGRGDEAGDWEQRWREDRFARLSPSSVSALEYADALRAAADLAEVHMEQLILGLSQKEDGPTRRLIDQAGVSVAELAAALEQASGTSIASSVAPVALTSLPPVSPHVADALDSESEAIAKINVNANTALSRR